MTNWKNSASKGVKLWAPPPPSQEGPVEAASESLLRLSVDVAMAERDYNLVAEPSILHSKLAIFHELFDTPEEEPSSPPTANTFVTTPQPLLSPAPSERHSTRSNSPPSSVDTTFTDHDFPSTPESPCAAKDRNYSHRQTGRTHHYFEEEQIHKDSSPMKLDFGRKMGKTAAPEYHPPHRWTYKERETVCCLWRWNARDTIAFTRIFNHIFEQSLSIRKVRCQFENYLRLHGPDAFLVYRDVFSSPFEPQGRYAAALEAIDIAAGEIGIKLHRLQEEHLFTAGEARTARSPKTRRLYRSLVKKASRDRKIGAMHMLKRITPPTKVGGFALRVDDSLESVDWLVDKEDAALPLHKGAQNLVTKSLAFRVFDQNSGTSFSEEKGFTAGAARLWNGPIQPFNINDPEGKRMILLTCNSHFGNDKIPSYWISVFTSLLEALVKAASMNRPRIAIIDLRHESLKVPDKVLPAAAILQELKKMGQAQWARTQHLAERLIFFDIPRPAIVQHLSLAELITISDSNDAVRAMMQLHEFEGRSTGKVAKSLAEREVIVDTFTAEAMAHVCNLFGLVELRHIHDLVARLVDGWGIIVDNASGDIEHIGLTFAMALGSRTHSLEDVVHAFVEGCQEGTQVLHYWDARRKSGSRRKRSS